MRPLSVEIFLINHFKTYAPVDAELVSWALNVPVTYVDLDADLSGMIEKRDDGRFAITINAKHPRTRQRFTIAHEFGHDILHQNLIGIGMSDDRGYRSAKVGQYQNTTIGPRHGSEANRFAADLLMPIPAVERFQDMVRANDPMSLARALRVSEKAYRI